MRISQAARAKLCFTVAVMAGALLAARPALAHHSFSMFDMEKRVTIVGTVTAFEWTNPHSYIEIDVAGRQGRREALEHRDG